MQKGAGSYSVVINREEIISCLNLKFLLLPHSQQGDSFDHRHMHCHSMFIAPAESTSNLMAVEVAHWF